MNKRHKYLLIDTETANSLDDPIVYNLAGNVIDQHGRVYETGNFLNMDIFADAAFMSSAYYANKIPQYYEQIQKKEIVCKTWREIRAWLREMCKKYNVKAIIAHNARFDYVSCSTTQRYETSSKYRYFFPYGVEIWDTLRMAQDTVCKQKRYIAWCKENGYVTKNGMPRATAEILYRYISKDKTFEEEHKAMEDVNIEQEIFWYCIRQHKPMRRNCFKKK